MSAEELRRTARLPWAEQARLGVAGLLVPEVYGGAGLGLVELGVVLEEHGRGLAATPLLSTALCELALLLGDDEEARRAWLPRLASGEVRLAWAHDEGPRHGRQVTARVEDGRCWADKSFVPDAGGAAALIVTTRDGVVLCEPGDATPMHLVDARPVARIRLEGTRVLARLGSPALAEAVLDRGAVAISAEMLGSMTRVFELTVAYLKTRHQFGVPIGSFQALQHRAARLHCELELTRSVVLAALEAPGDTRLASAAKARASDTFALAAAEAVQLHGGIGVTEALPIGRFFKRARAAAEILGTSAFHRRRFAAAG